jgi:hypothetical protein
VVIGRRSLLLAGAALPVAARGQCVTDALTVDACLGGVRIARPAGATLDLNFMSAPLDPRITFTRASTATYIDSTGTIQTAAVNQPRWDYAGGSLRGLLIEEARTNLLLNSATLGTQSVTVTAQAYTLSFYGTGTVTKSGAATGALVGTGAGQRVSQTFTPTAGTLTLTVTGSVTNAQIEAGGFVTSWMPTTAAAVTRAADSCVIPPANMGFYTSPGGSWLAEFISLVTNPTTCKIVAYPAAASRAQLYLNGANLVAQVDGSAGIGTANGITVGAVSKGASTWAANVGRVCANGGAVASGALTIGYPDAAATGTAFLQTGTPNESTTGYIRRVTYWPRVLSDAEMQQVTT